MVGRDENCAGDGVGGRRPRSRRRCGGARGAGVDLLRVGEWVEDGL